MAEAASDPYGVLGLAPDASDVELRRAYRALVKRHHPDHNGGSSESALRFAEIQQAYASIAARRRGAPSSSDPRGAARSGARPSGPPPAPGRPGGPAAGSDPSPSSDPTMDARLAALERELAAAREAQERLAQEQRAQERREREHAQSRAREQMERELAAREAARNASRAAATAPRAGGAGPSAAGAGGAGGGAGAGGAGANTARRPTPEELGYYSTDDSLTKIIDDAAGQLGERLRRSDAKREFARRLSDLFGRDR